jgi:regulator-associated protein of mTOR
METASRSRLVAIAGDNNNLIPTENTVQQNQLSNLFSDNIYLTEEWHSENYMTNMEEPKPASVAWRPKDRMKTSGAALVICLNAGVDPPDITKPNPCAKKHCWIEPTGSKEKCVEDIGNALQNQYEKINTKQPIKYKQCLDPTSEELRKTCMGLRKNAKSDRLLFHYNGHGVPKPTRNSELWVFGKHYTHYTPVAISELRSWLGNPAIYVIDCSGAGMVLQSLTDNVSRYSSSSHGLFDNETHNYVVKSNGDPQLHVSDTDVPFVLTACRANEVLPYHPAYPADMFTACLLTPIPIAVRWFILQVFFSLRCFRQLKSTLLILLQLFICIIYRIRIR